MTPARRLARVAAVATCPRCGRNADEVRNSIGGHLNELELALLLIDGNPPLERGTLAQARQLLGAAQRVVAECESRGDRS